MTNRKIMEHARKGQFENLTTSQLELAALMAFPSSPIQKSIRAEINDRIKVNLTKETN